MATYRQVHISFWQDPYIEDLSAKEKYFYLYLMTNSKTRQCGCYEISMKLIKYETGLTQQEIDQYISKLSLGNKIRYNEPNQEFLLLNWLKHNSFRSPKVLSCIVKELDSIKTIEFKSYINSFTNGDTTMDSLSESIDTGLQKEEEEEKEDNKKKQKEPYFVDELLNRTFIEFIDHRKSTKNKMSDIAITKAVNKINGFNCSIEEKVKAIDMAIERNWSGIFEPTDNIKNNIRKVADF